MDAQKFAMRAPLCHRCKEPMTIESEQTACGKVIEIFRCEKCKTLEAVELKKSA